MQQSKIEGKSAKRIKMNDCDLIYRVINSGLSFLNFLGKKICAQFRSVKGRKGFNGFC